MRAETEHKASQPGGLSLNWFKVPEWGVFCHTERLRNRPARLKLALSDSTILGHGANTVAANYGSGYALGVMTEHMEKAW